MNSDRRMKVQPERWARDGTPVVPSHQLGLLLGAS